MNTETVSSMEQAFTNELSQEMELQDIDSKLIKIWGLVREIRVETQARELRISGERTIQNNMKRINNIINDIGSSKLGTVVDLTTTTRPRCRETNLTIQKRLNPTTSELTKLINNDLRDNLFAISELADITEKTVLEILFGGLCK